jgi:hypothetical protein
VLNLVKGISTIGRATDFSRTTLADGNIGAEERRKKQEHVPRKVTPSVRKPRIFIAESGSLRSDRVLFSRRTLYL